MPERARRGRCQKGWCNKPIKLHITLDLRILEIHSIRTFLWHTLTSCAEILHTPLFYCTTDQVRVSSICVNFYRSYAPFGTKNTENIQFSAFLLNASTSWAEIWHITLFYCTTDQLKVLSICFKFCRSYALLIYKNAQFSALVSYMHWNIELKFCICLCLTVLQIKFECRQFAAIFAGVFLLLNLEYWEYTVFHTFFSLCFDIIIELKICKWLCLTVLQINFECCQFASIFVGGMPVLELSILEIHSFLHFSLTCIEILSWNFANDFVLLYYRSSSSVVNMRQFCGSYAPFGT